MITDTATHNSAQVPETLKSLDRWMGTIFHKRRDGKVNKPPYRVGDGKPYQGSKTNPDHWTSYEAAKAALERGEVDAIGFCLTEEDELFAGDLDGVVDRQSGELDQTAAEIIYNMDTYSELSVSHEGIHFVGWGSKPEFAQTISEELGTKVELYSAGAFIVITGARLAGTPAEPQPRQDELDALCRRLWPRREKGRRPEYSVPLDLTDEELLERARRSKTGKAFRALYDHGNRSGYTSPSEADYDLIRHLIFWAAGDADRIARLFRSSALFREEKKSDYVGRSVRNGLASYTGKFYRPRGARKVVRQEREKSDPLEPYLALLLDLSAWRGHKAGAAYKCYCGAVILAEESGVIGDDGSLRIGSDVRRLAEVAGVSATTLSRSTLPYLVQELKLVKWRRGKGTKAGEFTLPVPVDKTDNTRVLHTLVLSVLQRPETDLQALRRLIRMRSGHSPSALVIRLGMAAMFVAVALLTAPERGLTLEELAERTGRRKSDLRRVLDKLQGCGVARHIDAHYSLTSEYAAAYERSLDESGITYSERQQKRRHADDRLRRQEKRASGKQEHVRLRGREHMERVVRDATPEKERLLTVEDVGSELRRERSGPYLALKHYLDKPDGRRLGCLIGAVLYVRGRDPTKEAKLAHRKVVREAAADPANHPRACGCRRCA